MIEEIREFIAQERPQRLVEEAEDLGNQLGIARVSQITEIYRLINNSIQINRDKEDFKFLHLIRPKIAVLTAKTSPRERPAIEQYQYAIFDAIHCVNEGVDANDKKERLKRFKDFIEAVTAFHQYASNFGARYSTKKPEQALRNRILELQNRLGELLQFINMSTGKVKVFISHSHSDKPFAEKLKKDLEKEGVATWYDDKDLDIGDIVSEALSQGIEESYCFLIIVSQTSVKSNWVKYELDEAYDQHINEGKRILPVVIGDLKQEDMPRRLRKHLYADFRTDYKDAFQKLLRSIVREGAKKVDKS